MADLSRYSVIVGSVVTCNDCAKANKNRVVYVFGEATFSVDEMNSEILMHEWDHHEPEFADNADGNGLAAKRASEALAKHVERVEEDVRTGDYYACYPPATAYRDGMVNGMGGSTGDMASLLGPEAVRAIVGVLSEVAAMDKNYSELIADHNRKTCEDHTCSIFGHLVDLARAVDAQLEA
jgi:peptidoglycan/xylan/chitin deacetylase (PgdA/CDA1 family)